MAAGDITFYNNYKLGQFDGDAGGVLSNMPVVFGTDTIKIMVLDDTFTPDLLNSTTQEHLDNVSADEIATATGYTGPITLASETITETAGVVKYDALDVTIPEDGSGFTDARYVVFYKDSGAEATSPLICIGDLGANQSNVAGDLKFVWGAGGVFDLT